MSLATANTYIVATKLPSSVVRQFILLKTAAYLEFLNLLWHGFLHLFGTVILHWVAALPALQIKYAQTMHLLVSMLRCKCVAMRWRASLYSKCRPNLSNVGFFSTNDVISISILLPKTCDLCKKNMTRIKNENKNENFLKIACYSFKFCRYCAKHKNSFCKNSCNTNGNLN